MTVPDKSVTPTIKFCPECGIGVIPGDGGVGAFGQTFCSESCVDEAEQAQNGELPERDHDWEWVQYD